MESNTNQESVAVDTTTAPVVDVVPAESAPVDTAVAADIAPTEAPATPTEVSDTPAA